MKKYNDLYRATVKDVDDPRKQGRMRLEIPSVHGKNLSAWAKPISPLFLWFPPEVGDQVYVRFVEGNSNKPAIVGQWYGERDTKIKEFNKEDYNGKKYKDQIQRKRVKTHKGHTIELNDIDDDERVMIETQGGHILELRDDLNGEEQYVELTTTDGHRIYVNDTKDGKEQITIEDLKGNKIQLDTVKNDLNISAQNDEKKEIGNNSEKTVGNNETKNIGATLTINASSSVVVNSPQTTVNGKATVTGVTNIGGGGPAVARLGDKVQVEVTGGSSAGTYIGYIIEGAGNSFAG
jgi:uncharacterized protein involved in type VI secretion and phage assembly